MTTTTQTERTGPAGLELRIAPDSYNPETRDFEVVMSTGAAVRRFSWVRGAYDEVLSLKPEHIRLDRINSGRAPFVEEHRHLSLDATIGTIAEGSVEIRGGELVGRVRMHETPRAVEMQERMARGELTSVSLGYRTYEQEVVESDEGPDTRTAIDWEPFELSLTPMPADNGAHTRSGELESFECVIRSRTETLMPEPNDDETPEPKSPKKRSAPEPAESNPKQRSAPAAPEPTGAAPEPNLDAERRGAEAERKRSAEIRKLTRTCRLEDSVSEDLIARGISLEQAREEILEKWNERHGGDEVHSHVRVGEEAASKRGAAIERVLLARFDARRYALKDDDDARQMSGDSLMEMGARHLAELGVNLVSIGSKSERADRMLALRAGYHTSTDFGVILGNVTGRILRDSYRTARRSFE
ncbi:MAG: HK97 family phage prohead protease, partial [Planctomycetota bacterium]